jgi:hypothetical protein
MIEILEYQGIGGLMLAAGLALRPGAGSRSRTGAIQGQIQIARLP